MPEFRLIQISDTPPCPPPADLDPELSSGQRIHRRQASDLVVTAAILLSTGRPIATISNLPASYMQPFPLPAVICPAIMTSATTRRSLVRLRLNRPRNRSGLNFLSIFGEDRWRFDAAGWRFHRAHSLVMNTGLASEAEQYDWLALQTLQRRRQAGSACFFTNRFT